MDALQETLIWSQVDTVYRKSKHQRLHEEYHLLWFHAHLSD